MVKWYKQYWLILCNERLCFYHDIQVGWNVVDISFFNTTLYNVGWSWQCLDHQASDRTTRSEILEDCWTSRTVAMSLIRFNERKPRFGQIWHLVATCLERRDLCMIIYDAIAFNDDYKDDDDDVDEDDDFILLWKTKPLLNRLCVYAYNCCCGTFKCAVSAWNIRGFNKCLWRTWPK